MDRDRDSDSDGYRTLTSGTNDLALQYTLRESASPGTGRPLIVVQCPGWGLGSRYLEVGLSMLEADFPLLYIQPRGTGGSSRPDDSDRMGSIDMAQDLEELRIHLGIDSFPVLLGHSNGGTIALLYAEMFPMRVDRLVLIDHRLLGLRHNPASEKVAVRRIRKFLGPGHGDGDLDEKTLLARLGSSSDDELTTALEQLWPAYFHDAESYIPVLRSALGGQVVDAWCMEMQKKADKNPDVGERMKTTLKNVTAETLILFGRNDAICDPTNAETTQYGIKNSVLVLLDECGHFPWIEKPAETMDAITNFIKA